MGKVQDLPALRQAVGALIRHVNVVENGPADSATESRVQAVIHILRDGSINGPVARDTLSVLMGTVVTFRPDLDDTDVILKALELLPVVLPRHGVKNARLVQSDTPT